MGFFVVVFDGIVNGIAFSFYFQMAYCWCTEIHLCLYVDPVFSGLVELVF